MHAKQCTAPIRTCSSFYEWPLGTPMSPGEQTLISRHRADEREWCCYSEMSCGLNFDNLRARTGWTWHYFSAPNLPLLTPPRWDSLSRQYGDSVSQSRVGTNLRERTRFTPAKPHQLGSAIDHYMKCVEAGKIFLLPNRFSVGQRWKMTLPCQ